MHRKVVERAVETMGGDLGVRHLPHAAVDEGEAQQDEDEVRDQQRQQPRPVVVGEVGNGRNARRPQQRLVDQHGQRLTGGYVDLAHVGATTVLV